MAMEVYGDQDLTTALVWNNWATRLQRWGRPAEAVFLLEKVVLLFKASKKPG